MDVIKTALKEGRKTLSEYEAKKFLSSYGVTGTREIESRDLDEFKGAVKEIGFPIVIKLCGPNQSHKTEQGLVRVDVRNQKEAEDTFHEFKKMINDKNESVLVQEMVRGQRELVVGLTRDIQFGPCVMFGLGGIFTEILEDVSFRVAPIEKKDAFDMMQMIKGKRILESVRGMPKAELEQLADILIKVGNIGIEREEIKEIDINPIVLSGGKPIAVDALIVLDD